MSLSKYHQISQVKYAEIEKNVIEGLFKGFRIKSLLSLKAIVKSKGVQPFQILLTMFLMLFQNKRSIAEALKYLDRLPQKSTINDFLNNPFFKWRPLLLSVAQFFTRKFCHDEGKYSVLIIDDTAKKKSGRFVEAISNFYDHSTQTYFRGYQVVIAAWSNLRTCIPFDIVLKTGKKRSKHAKRCDCPENSHTYKRYRESRLKKTTIAIAMICRALRYKIDFKYVLWDSWFNCSKAYIFAFDKLISKGIHLISMVKRGKELYKLGKQYLTLQALQIKAGAWITDKDTGIKYKSINVEIVNKSDECKSCGQCSKTSKPQKCSKPIEQKPIIGTVKLCFFKFKNKGKKQVRTIQSTDTSLTEMQVLEIYTQRWSIEVMIKDLKQYFGFNQSMSSKYAPQLTDLTIKCIFYIMICSLKERTPNKSVCQLIFEFGRQIEEYCTAMFTMYLMKSTFEKFVKSIKHKEITQIEDLIPIYDDFIDDFFNRNYIDKIIEVDIIKNEQIA